MKCVWCGKEFKPGEQSFPGDLFLFGRYHPRCLMAQERGDVPPTFDTSGPRGPWPRGLWQLILPKRSEDDQP